MGISTIGAAGYKTQAQDVFSPAQMTGKIMTQYNDCALLPQIAKSDFFTEDEVMCGSVALYDIAREIDMFGRTTDNNEDVEYLDGPNLEHASMRICQQKKFQIKLSNLDKKRMCSNFDKWEETLRKQIDVGISKYVDYYSINKVLAGAAKYNTGKHAGKISGKYDLGDQGTGALEIKNVDQFMNAINNLIDVGIETNMINTEGCDEGDRTSPIILIPASLRRFALDAVKGLDTCCSDKNAIRTGLIGMIGNVRILPTLRLPTLKTTTGVINHMALIDPNRVFHAFSIITNKWYEDKFEDYLVGEYVFDTQVMDPNAVAVAAVQA